MQKPYYATFFKDKKKEFKKDDFYVKTVCPEYIIEEDDCTECKLEREHPGTTSIKCDGVCFTTMNEYCFNFNHKPGKFDFSRAIKTYEKY